MKGEIYVIFNYANNKPYVGQTIKGYLRRFSKHKEAAKRGSNLALHRAIRKYGEEKFWVDLLETITAETEDELLTKLNQKEIYWIKALNSKREGYNMTSGGQGLLRPTPETRKKISEHQTISEEQRERLRNLRTGQPPWCKGKKLSKRIRKKISKSRKGWKPTEETRKIWSEQRKGRTHSEETRRKMSEAQIKRFTHK
jgi:group I intron endonuclease